MRIFRWFFWCVSPPPQTPGEVPTKAGVSQKKIIILGMSRGVEFDLVVRRGLVFRWEHLIKAFHHLRSGFPSSSSPPPNRDLRGWLVWWWPSESSKQLSFSPPPFFKWKTCFQIEFHIYLDDVFRWRMGWWFLSDDQQTFMASHLCRSIVLIIWDVRCFFRNKVRVDVPNSNPLP